jgi:hypothetical protein
LAIASLSRVQVEEQLLSDSDDSIVAYIARFALNNLPQQQAGSLMLFRIAEGLE